jgi:spore germination protein YaaH/flagellar hook assembly protein FlgD
VTGSSVPDAPGVPDAAAGLQQSIHYEEAEAHRNDKIDFAPGGRVDIGFTPRPDDRWTVGGGEPATLPPGRADGRKMRSEAAPGVDPASGSPMVDVPNDAQAPAPVAGAVSRLSTDPAAIEGPSVRPEAVVTLTGLRREIFGFLPYWQLNSSTLRLDHSKISTIAYFGVGADAAGNLVRRNTDGSTSTGWSGWTSSKMTSIISAAHRRHTRVVLTVLSFGWNTTGLARQKALLGSPTARLNLARQIAAAVRDRGTDGVNLDFEPLASGYDTQFTALVRTIRTLLNRTHRGYQLTFDTTGSIGNYPIENATAAGGADAIFIMGYDYRGPSSSPVGSVAPLDGNGYDIRETVAAYIARVPASKVILGVPYYGRAWSTATNLLNATNTSGSQFGASTSVIYSTAADYLAQYGRQYDGVEKVAWTAYQRQNCTATYGCVTSWRQIYVDDAAAIKAKYDVVNAYGLRGAGIWALGYDGTRTDLWQAIQVKFVTDTTPPTVGIRTLPLREPNPAFGVAWTGRDDVAIRSYDVQVSIDGGAWASWIKATTAASAAWYGVDGHIYAFRVRARDLKGNVSEWNVTGASDASVPLAAGAFGIVRVDGLSVRSAAHTTATKLGTLDAGNVVAVVGGPRAADGYIWYQVRGPLTEWGAVRPLAAAGWVAAQSGTAAYLSPTKPPHTTRVDAAIGAVSFGLGGGASLGTSTAAIASRSFSPNGDGSKDALAIDWTNQVTLDSLGLKVFRADGTRVGTSPLGGQPAAGARRFVWNGRVGAATLPNGRYLATLVGTASGSTYFNPSPGFLAMFLPTFGITIDTVAPTISSASVSGSLLSPNGDGRFDTVRVAIAARGAAGWAFTASPVTGSTVGAPVAGRSGIGAAVALTWNGRTTSGALAPDGIYRLSLAAVDLAGNVAVRSWNVRLDTIPPVFGLAATPASFSPNGDGTSDTVRLGWTSTERISGTARILHGSTVVRSWTIRDLAGGAATWSGLDGHGRRVADGAYTYVVTGRDATGNATSHATRIVVDRTLGSLRWTPGRFFPQDGDALAPTAKASFGLTRRATVTLGIYQGTTLIRTVWSNRTFAAGIRGWTWNGRTAAGALVPQGRYTVQVAATTSLGTSVVTRTVDVGAFAVDLSATTLRSGQTLIVTFATAEPLKANPTVSFTQHARAAVTRAATRLGDGRYRVSFRIAAGGVGPATLKVTGRDTAGGINSTSRTIRVQ